MAHGLYRQRRSDQPGSMGSSQPSASSGGGSLHSTLGRMNPGAMRSLMSISHLDGGTRSKSPAPQPSPAPPRNAAKAVFKASAALIRLAKQSRAGGKQGIGAAVANVLVRKKWKQVGNLVKQYAAPINK